MLSLEEKHYGIQKCQKNRKSAVCVDIKKHLNPGGVTTVTAQDGAAVTPGAEKQQAGVMLADIGKIFAALAADLKGS